jgi:hypothetical protein
VDDAGQVSEWSSVRRFSIGAGAVVFPMPGREELLGRIPKGHPRLFVRPEQLARLCELARGELRESYEKMVEDCERLLENPPDTSDPPKYPPGTQVKSEEWRKIWWGNRERTIKALNAAATLGFVWLLDGNERYGREAKRILIEVARWDVRGATNYHYNDEAGMPYVYFFARAYTFVNDLLDDGEKAKCREVIRFRGNEMYAHLNPRHLWTPYASHSNRAWHKLGEAGIAFLDEIPEARDWVWFAMNVFYNVYPVWSDADGGWHEGVAYWNSYVSRFTYFADVMRVAMEVDAYKKPYFSKAGYYAMYLQPPGTPGGGFGDLVPERTPSGNRALMTALAAQARNPHWRWYVDAIGGPSPESGYIGFVRGSLPKVDPKAPEDLPTSRAFHGIGQAFLNTTLKDVGENVQFGFKSSPLGTQSHGYDANNSFFLYAYGQRLFAPTGRRDVYGSDHHRDWMWETKSTNSITVNGRGQTPKHSVASQGKVIGFETSKAVDYVAGDAGGAYGDALTRFERHVLFFKPELLVIYDVLEAPQPSTFEWRLHSPVEIKTDTQYDIGVVSGPATARVGILWPMNLEVRVTDQYDVPPRPRVKAKEWHLTAKTAPSRRVEFVSVVFVHRTGELSPTALYTPADRTLKLRLKDARVTLKVTDPGDGAPPKFGVVRTAGGGEVSEAVFPRQ